GVQGGGGVMCDDDHDHDIDFVYVDGGRRRRGEGGGWGVFLLALLLFVLMLECNRLSKRGRHENLEEQEVSGSRRDGGGAPVGAAEEQGPEHEGRCLHH